MYKNILLFIFILLFLISNAYSQSGTFNFESAFHNGNSISISEIQSGVTLTVYSDLSELSTTLQDWSGFSELYTGNVATMNGIAKPSVTLSFSEPVNIASFVVCEFDGNDVHLQFTPNTGSPFDLTIDGFNGTVIEQDMVQVSSIVITSYGGGTINLAFDNITMDGSLPVELSSFTANIIDRNIQLNWQTATEVNNFGFEIEKIKADKKDKSVYSWVKAGFVEGSGNSNSPKSYSFTDQLAESGKYLYRLKQIDNDGKFEYSPEVQVAFEIPEEFCILQNFPNPFNPSTKINYALPVESFVTLKIFDILGREVETLVNQIEAAGIHEINFDRNYLSSGTYIYQIKAGEFSKTMKMILMK